MPYKITTALFRTCNKLQNRRILSEFDKGSTKGFYRNFSVSSSKKMRFVQFRAKSGGPQRLGAQLSITGDIFDISAVDPSIPNTLVKFLNSDDDVLERAKRIVAAGKAVLALDDVVLLAPITKPDKVACVGMNYKGHCDEKNIPHPVEPTIFSKFSSCIVGPYDNIELPKVSERVDWEVELAIVIGKKAKTVRPDQAEDYIFGYTLAQDISARDWQMERNNKQFLLGKSMDTFCPLGPAVVTKNAIDVSNLRIQCSVNGVVKQDSTTSDVIFKPNIIVSYLSQIMTLLPGDIILTGTPSGVGLYRSPPEFLCKGDVLESEIEGIGKMKNVVV